MSAVEHIFLCSLLSLHVKELAVSISEPEQPKTLYPSADNAKFYSNTGLPFVMGTTGGDREQVIRDVEASGVYAVVAPNMGKQIVAFQTMIEMMAERFPGCFAGYTLEVVESHQRTKVDTSGTAKAVVASFKKMGLDFEEVSWRSAVHHLLGCHTPCQCPCMRAV